MNIYSLYCNLISLLLKDVLFNVFKNISNKDLNTLKLIVFTSLAACYPYIPKVYNAFIGILFLGSNNAIFWDKDNKTW